MSDSAPRLNIELGVPERNSSMMDDSDIHMTDREVEEVLARQIQGAQETLKKKQAECK